MTRPPAKGLKPLPCAGQNWHHRAFFIKALVLGDTFADIRATLRCNDATNCLTSAPSAQRPCWP